MTTAVPIGDPAGIGPEVVVKALATGEPQARGRVVLVGSVETLERAARTCSAALRFRPIRDLDAEAGDDGRVAVLDAGELRSDEHVVGKPSAAGGRASFAWLRTAIALAEAGRVEACVMGPIDRSSFKAAGILGTTDEMQPPETFQFRVSGKLRVVPIVEHERIRDVPAFVTKERVLRVILLIGEHLVRWGFPAPKIGVAGLNPHAAGEEDAIEIAPAVAEARERGWAVEGPISPDAVFRHAAEGRYDAVVAMYHDQGQIAIKTTAFAGACTIFVGLPYVRIGVPHGTAMEIAGTGTAQHLTMLSALNTAAALASGSGL